MPIKTKRWCDPHEADDGLRILVCRYRPRALPKAKETWDAWYAALGPSRTLHAELYGKHGASLDWEEFRKRYLAEMTAQTALIADLAEMVAAGQTITLLCATPCTDPLHCHRTLLHGLIEEQLSSRLTQS